MISAPPRFSRDERDRRHAAVRAAMRAGGFDCLSIPHHTGEWDNYQADGRYLTCIGGGGAATAVIFPVEGEPVVAVREERRIRWWREQQDWISDKSAAGKDRKASRTMGHGIGHGQDVPLTIRGGKAGRLVVEEGDCFVLKPWVEDDVGTVSVRFGANVVVGDNGAVLLTATYP